ncbi:hypothetical protein ABZS81_19205 [Streptomyces sp. NPDC005318]|uniref:three-helix bundle dimerization domain-containing protein n=1 Tax=Streptomyces sp. NPDC005318 TaxID=3157031 RepID=UPI0033AD6CCB
MVAQPRAAYLSVDAVAVEATVRTAYGRFHEARVRNYIPILVERRSRRAPSVACRTAPGQAIDGTAGLETRRAPPGPARN